MTATPDEQLSESAQPAPDGSLRVLSVVGPTAVGKTELAERLALHFTGEVISADSMQVYRGMDIGTAKPAPDARRVPYHCIDIADPGTGYSAALFQRDARTAIADIARRGMVPILAGGTGLYLRAALDELHFPAGEALSPVRERLERDAATLGSAALHARLAALDPASAALIHPNNVRRTVRALEMAHEGVSYANQAAGFSERQSVYDTRFLGLTMEREALYARIDDRVDAMIAAGLRDEVAALLDAGLREALTAASAIGYKELVPVIEHAADFDSAVSEIKQASRRYAKRQLTWFRADSRISWLDVTELSPAVALSDALRLLESDEPVPYPPAAGC